MATCRRQRCEREAERAPAADGQCILHAQKYLAEQRKAGKTVPEIPEGEEPDADSSE